MSEFNARFAHKVLQQQMEGVLDALAGRPKKKLKDMLQRGGKQKIKGTHYEVAYDNVIEGRDLRLAGKWLKERDRHSKYRVLGYDIMDHMLSLTGGSITGAPTTVSPIEGEPGSPSPVAKEKKERPAKVADEFEEHFIRGRKRPIPTYENTPEDDYDTICLLTENVNDLATIRNLAEHIFEADVLVETLGPEQDERVAALWSKIIEGWKLARAGKRCPNPCSPSVEIGYEYGSRGAS